VSGQGYLHPSLGFAIHLPDMASVVEEHDTRVLFALATEEVDRPAIITVDLSTIDPGWDSATFARAALAAQTAVLSPIQVLDHGPAEIAGVPAVRALLHHTREDGRPEVLEEWRIAQQGRGWTVSTLCPVTSHHALAPLIRATAESLVLPEAVEPLPLRPSFDSDSGVLALAAGELKVLTELHRGRPPGEDAGRAALARLEEAGVVVGGAPQPAVAAMLAAVDAATMKLTIQRPGGDAMAWWHEGRAVLLLRIGADRRQLSMLDGARLPSVLADRLGLGPRPAARGRERIETTVQELANAFAGAASGTVGALVASRRDHWRIDALLLEPQDLAVLEAFDTPDGWWLVRPEGEAVVLEPVTATVLWDHLAELVAVAQ
jgi:hypothetical protein